MKLKYIEGRFIKNLFFVYQLCLNNEYICLSEFFKYELYLQNALFIHK